MKRMILLLCITTLSLVVLGNEGLAQRDLDIDYPDLPFGEVFDLETVATPLPQYFQYIFYFLIAASGAVALIVLVTAGLRYTASAGDPGKISDARKQISGALFGLVLLFSSFLILRTINPQLTTLHLAPTSPVISGMPAGILICKENVQGDLKRAWDLRRQFEQLIEDLGNARTDPEVHGIVTKQGEIESQVQPLFQNISEQCKKVESFTYWRGIGEGASVICSVPSVGSFINRSSIYVTDDDVIDFGAISLRQFSSGTPGGTIQKSHILIPNVLEFGDQELKPICKEIGFVPLRIRPFVLVTEGCERDQCKIIVYEEENRNIGFQGKQDDSFSPRETPMRGQEILLFPPKSIEVRGDLIVVLKKDDASISIFTEGIDNNLLDNLPIVEWVRCEEEFNRFGPVALPPDGGTFTCPKPAATSIEYITGRLF